MNQNLATAMTLLKMKRCSTFLHFLLNHSRLLVRAFIVKKIIEYESIKFDQCPEISKKLDGNPNIFNYLKLIKTKVVVSESLFLISNL